MKRRYLIFGALAFIIVVMGGITFGLQIDPIIHYAFQTATLAGQVDPIIHKYVLVDPSGVPTGSSGPPTGAAGGDLGGTYPNPTVVKTTGDVSHITNVNGVLKVNNSTGANGGDDLVIALDPLTLGSTLEFLTQNDPINGSWSLAAEATGGGTDWGAFAIDGSGVDCHDGTASPYTNSCGFIFGYAALPITFAALPAACSSTMAGDNFQLSDALTNKLGDVITVGGGTGKVEVTCFVGVGWVVTRTSNTSGANLTAVPNTALVSLPVVAGSKGSLFASTTVSASAPAVVGCTDTTVAVASATTSMTVAVSPQANPNGAGVVTWAGYISAAGTADVRVCALTVDTTPPAVTYNVLVLN